MTCPAFYVATRQKNGRRKPDWGRERQLGGRLTGAHKLEGGGDRVRLSSELARDAIDADKRQRAAIEGFARRAGLALVDEFTDAAVSGADPIETRPGFSALLDRIEGNGVRTVIVEDASRFARELVTQELGILALIKRGVRVLTASGDDLTDSSDPSRVMMRQIAGSFAQYEKTRLVAKLRAARERRRVATGKCEGRKSWAEINPELVRQAKRLRRRSPKGHQRSLRDVAAELGKLGFSNERGSEFSAAAVSSMIGS
jgi:DNA invertase Pin-like site-specific DNA recombinase